MWMQAYILVSLNVLLAGELLDPFTVFRLLYARNYCKAGTG